MRKEIAGIFLFFLVVFTLISLLSYHAADPSILNANAADSIHNLFGIVGAHLAGILIGLFGLGAFWIPVLLLLASIQILSSQPNKALALIPIGGTILIISTGSLFSFKTHQYQLLGTWFSSGGLIGFPLKTFLVEYSNTTGAAIILVLMWIVGFIMATGFSLIAFAKRVWVWGSILSDRSTTLYLKWKNRRQKSLKRVKRLKESARHSEKKSKNQNKPQKT